jgi:phage replication O-like protein O
MQLEQPLANYTGNPQLENGYLKIANELLEQFMIYGFSSRQWSVVMAVVRMTYGYNKKSDALSGWQISKLTGIDRSHVSKTLAELINLNVIKKHNEGRVSHGSFVNEISINKNYDTWITVAKKATVAKTAPLPKSSITVAETATVTVAELATQPLPKQPTHKDISKYNKNISKDIEYFSEIDPEILKEWKAVRKKKRAAELSKIIYNAMLRESNLAGLTLEQAVVFCVEKSWISFSAEWYKNAVGKNKLVIADRSQLNKLTTDQAYDELFGSQIVEKDVTYESE